MALTISPAVAAAAVPPIPEAMSWLEGAALPPDRPPLDLAQAVPNYDPAPELLDYLGRAVREPASAFYTPILGIPALRDGLAASLSEEYGTAIAPGEVRR